LRVVLVCMLLLVVGWAGSAGAAGPLTRSAVKKIAAKVIKKQAPTLSVQRAAVADRATTAGSADTAKSASSVTGPVTGPVTGSVNGVTTTPLSYALEEGDPAVYPVDIQGTQVELLCTAGGLQIATRRGSDPAPPMVGVVSVPAGSSSFVRLGFGGGGSAGVVPHQVVHATVREASGRVTRVELEAFYSQNGFGGTDDCFATGQLEQFGG
jgi:hypothetical protein